jgi:hypothetical protein
VGICTICFKFKVFCTQCTYVFRMTLRTQSSDFVIRTLFGLYRGSDKFLARPTSPCILFDGENISFDARLVIYIYI